MSDSPAAAPLQVDSLAGRIETLAEELELSIRWQRPCVLFALYSSEYVRADAAALLEDQLIDLGQEIFHVRVEGARDNLFPLLQESETSTALIFFVEGLRWGRSGEQSLYASLDRRRDLFKESEVRAVFWLTEDEYVDLARQAPHFWGLRHAVVEFVESPTPEQVMQQVLEAAWQGTGEYASRFDGTDEEISLRKSLLTGNPAVEEATGLRASHLLTLGLLNWRKGDFEMAEQHLQEALKIAANDQDKWLEAECLNGLALVKTSLSRIDEAIDAYKQAIRLSPEQIFAWNNLGNLCMKIGRNDEAIVAFMKAVECNPQDPVAWNGLGSVYQGIGYHDDAIAAYRRSIRSMPSFAPPWSGLGDACASTGKTDEAVKAYEKAIELNGKFVTPWLRLAVIYARQERYGDAARAYQRALALDARNACTWNELGLMCVRLDAWQEAEKAFSKAIEIDRGYGPAFSNLATAYSRQGKYNESIPLYRRSIELLQDGSDQAACWNGLGNVYRLMKDYDSALAAYQMADSLGKENTPPPVDESAAEASPRPEEAAGTEPTGAADIQEQAEEPAPAPLAGEQEPPAPAEEPEIPEAPHWIFQQSPQAGDSIEPGQDDHQAAPGSLTAQDTGGTAMSIPQTFDPASPGETVIPPTPNGPDRAGKPASGEADALAWNEKGNTYFKRGAYEDAIKAYNKAIQLDPAFGWPYGNLALSYLSQGRPAEAILLYQKSIALMTSNSERALSWNGLGNAYRLMHDYASALSAYQKAAELDPATAGMRDGAETSKADPALDTAQAWSDLGDSLMKSGSYDPAAAAFRKAISLDPGLGWPYSNLARILASQGKHAQAIPLYQKSIELLADKKDKAVSWNRLGNTYRKLNDYDNAIKAFQEAVALSDEGMNLVTRARFSLLSNCYPA